MLTQFSRNELLFGTEATGFLNTKKVLIFGIGGVGSFAAEALARSGIGQFVLVDADIVCITNINRQIIATHKTIGRPKVDVMKERILEINPNASVSVRQVFLDTSNLLFINFSDFSYVLDCIDTVTSKLLIIEEAKIKKIPIICCMGTGNKLDPLRLEVTDINKTSVCPLARVIRHELKRRKIKKLKVLYSREVPLIPFINEEVRGNNNSAIKRPVPGSVSFVPPVAGMIIAGEVIKDLLLGLKIN